MMLLHCQPDESEVLVPGVSWQLAKQRYGQMSGLQYDLHLNVPSQAAAPIRGEVTITFVFEKRGRKIALDFRQPADQILSVSVNGETREYSFTNGHIVLSQRFFQPGENKITIEFIAGDGPLNRSDDFLYTLFVPDRASVAFPCVDQPNLKGRFRLTLDVPDHWQAVSNTRAVEDRRENERRVLEFAQTEPISTYLFAFVAGEFQVLSSSQDGREMNMYHRETDREKVERNAPAIFDLHRKALAWLEAYTIKPLPFSKFDFVLIPAFQYNGMEHPGAVLYRAERLLLDASATQSDYLGRASLIAHESAHMWFGNLVTMAWFDDVWLKEVFANFMAAKIVNPSFPEVNHDLRFLLAHHPAAYAVDRSAGANPILQPLDNLLEAGTLYGAIIYQKAPVVMRQLELLMGPEVLREGLREYVKTYSYTNATWGDLIALLDKKTEHDLGRWSKVWVHEAGMPTIETSTELADSLLRGLVVRQADPAGRGRLWPQQVQPALGSGSAVQRLSVELERDEARLPFSNDRPAPDFVLGNSSGTAYGFFRLDERSRTHLLQHLSAQRDPVVRGAAWLALWEEMLHGAMAPELVLGSGRRLIEVEPELQLAQHVLENLELIYWKFLTPAQQQHLAPEMEAQLWRLMQARPLLATALFRTYRSVALSDSAVTNLEAIWRQQRRVPHVTLSESDYTDLAFELALREVPAAASILDRQAAAITNPDRRSRFAFIRAALDADASARDDFFDRLRQVENRAREPWVLDALRLLHHPLRAESAEKYIRPSLDLLLEVQQTGDIFFPRRWLDATLSGHSSPRAAATVRDFLDAHSAYPPKLRGKILQAADMLFRAVEMQEAVE